MMSQSEKDDELGGLVIVLLEKDKVCIQMADGTKFHLSTGRQPGELRIICHDEALAVLPECANVVMLRSVPHWEWVATSVQEGRNAR